MVPLKPRSLPCSDARPRLKSSPRPRFSRFGAALKRLGPRSRYAAEVSLSGSPPASRSAPVSPPKPNRAPEVALNPHRPHNRPATSISPGIPAVVVVEAEHEPSFPWRYPEISDCSLPQHRFSTPASRVLRHPQRGGLVPIAGNKAFSSFAQLTAKLPSIVREGSWQPGSIELSAQTM